MELIEELTDKYEQTSDKLMKAINSYPDSMLNTIIGFEITVQELQGKVKIGQNKTQRDLNGVIKALDKSSLENEKAISELVKKYLNQRIE